jgi:acetyl esterase/lipase
MSVMIFFRSFTAVCLVLGIAAPVMGQSAVIPLWPSVIPDPIEVAGAERDMSPSKVPGHNQQLTNISNPSMIVFPVPEGVKNNGAAVLVFPGGAYKFLNMKNAGTEPCAWVNSLGMTCFLVKYRVPVKGYFPEQKVPLEDAQQAVRIVRSRATEWGIDPKRIGLMGFSAGANLVLIMNSHPDDAHILETAAAAEVPRAGDLPVDAKSNFTIVCWPAFVAVKPEETLLDPNYKPNAWTPITFLIQAEDDQLAHNNALVYYRALMDAKVPGELHYYATGGHAFGMHPDNFAQAHWPDVAATWLRYNKIIPGWVGATGPREYNPEALDAAH